jgi:hypothetical protein
MWAVEGVPLGKMLVKRCNITGLGHGCLSITVSCSFNPVSYVWVKPRVVDLRQNLGFGVDSNNNIPLNTSAVASFLRSIAILSPSLMSDFKLLPDNN